MGIRNGEMVSEIQEECLQFGKSVCNRGIDGVRNRSHCMQYRNGVRKSVRNWGRVSAIELV